jgi:hypothetical protein
MFIGFGTNYALYEGTGDGVDTVRVWGPSPHAPTMPINNFAVSTTISVAPD